MKDHPLDDLVALADGTLDHRDRDRVVRHLEECASCREAVADIRTAVGGIAQVVGARGAAPFSPAQVAAQLRVRARREQSVRHWVRQAPHAVRRATVGLTLVGLAVTIGSLRRVGEPMAVRESPSPSMEAGVATDTSLSRYLIVLWARAASPTVAASVEDRRQAYRTWRTVMARSGRLAASGQLSEVPPILLHDQPLAGPDTASLHVASRRMRGFLVVRARNATEAVALARLSPDIGFGGLVTVSALR